MIGLDTNVLARYLLRDDPTQWAAAAAVIETLTTEEPGFITHVTLIELHWLLARKHKSDRDSRLSVIRGLIETEAFEFEDGECVVQALSLAEEGADFPDALISATGDLFGVRETVTFDRRASRSPRWRLIEV